MLQPAPQASIAVDVDHVTKRFGDIIALDRVSLDIRDREFFTLLGPSGCGKTTLLRTIAGLEGLSEGTIRLYGQSITALPPNKRPVNTVFQQYALFPHMTVVQNVMFGLLRLRVNEKEARDRALEVLEMVRMFDFTERRPAQLSGGQQQRVALARALAPRPKVLLLDEPLSALDLKLRQAVRVELKQLQRNTGITFVFVTHDQEEALTMSDRIAVMSEGEVQQVGSARDIYEAPKNRFVAGFIGEINILDVTVLSVKDEQATVALPGGREFTCPAEVHRAPGPGHLAIRPERLTLTLEAEATIRGSVSNHVYLGTDMQVHITLDDGEEIMVRVQNCDAAQIPRVGTRVGANIEAGAARLLAD